MRTYTWITVVLLAACGGGGSKPTAKPEPMAAAAPSNAEPAATPAAAEMTAAPKKSDMPAPQTMAQKMEMTTRALVTAWNAHEVDSIAAQYEANGTLTVLGMPEFKGKDGVKAEATETLTAAPDFKVGVSRVFTKDKVAVVEWVVTGTNTGDSPMMKATKRPFGVHGVSVVTFADSGLIKEEHRYFDIPTQMSQLDAKAKKGTFRPIAELPTDKPAMLSAGGDDDEAENLQAVNAVYDAIDAHKVDDVMKYMSPDLEGDDYTEPAGRKGTKSVKEYLGVFFKAVPDMKQDRTTQIVAGNLVVTEGVMHGTLKGNLGPLKATKKPITLHFVDIVTIKDGKFAHMTTYANSMELMPPPAAAAKKK
ncbi:MAG TPA: ester cyclase [Kofleriaceae bacterium]|jgi:ketosteroid isomerase-like protein|nr:ester cyclase [Kofleriaceae bacterium]